MNPEDSAGFAWTGHPFIDFGVATMMAWCGLNDPEDTPEQLSVGQVQEFAQEAAPAYFTKPDLFKSVMLAFGSNFLNPSFTQDKQLENVRYYLGGYQHPTDETLPLCTFFRRPSVAKLSRDAFPLLMGRGPINFYPGGEPGLAVSGQAMTAIQAIIFGALRSQGKLMVLAADDLNLLRQVVREWVGLVQNRIHLSRLNNDLEDLAPAKTALIGTLERLEKERLTPTRASFGKTAAKYYGSATLYHFSNSGQGPSLEIYSLPASILNFVQQAQAPEYNPAWQEIKRRGWPRPKQGKKAAPLSPDFEPPAPQQLHLSNRFFNDLFNLPEKSKNFVSFYFLGTMRSLVEKSAEGAGYKQLLGSTQIHSLGDLTGLFMKEVMEVQANRIEAIKQLADRLAEIVQDDVPRYKRLLQLRGNRWSEVRQLLRQFSRRETERGRAPVVTLEQFFTIFEMGEDSEYVDWVLAWDLVLIRLMEALFERGFYQKHQEEVKELAAEENEEEAEQVAI